MRDLRVMGGAQCCDVLPPGLELPEEGGF